MKRDRVVSFRCNRFELLLARRAAEARCMPLADLMRTLVRGAAADLPRVEAESVRTERREA